MLVILDSESPSRRAVFRDPRQVVLAVRPEEVPAALRAIEQAIGEGFHVAGWFAYELAYALEPSLRDRMPAGLHDPLLKFGVFDSAAGAVEIPRGRAYAGPLHLEWTREDYERRFLQVQELIAAGDIYQANLSMRGRFVFAGEPRVLYEKLRASAHAQYCAFVEDQERALLSISPELFLAADPGGRLTMRPMKGTAPRGTNDDAERKALASSSKDRAENLMIVDLIRNDLGRVARTGTVRVQDLFQVETYPTLHTMVSTVTAEKKPDCSVLEVLQQVFPSGSVTGAPKIRAMEILSELEPTPRGAYCGAIGHFAPDGSARFNVAIRTIAIAQGQGTLSVGGGVVHDSRPQAEYDECLVKTRFFERVRQPLRLLETLRYSPRHREFVRVERHLARMSNSAERLGLPFRTSDAWDALHASILGREEEEMRVRLTLDESGVHHAVVDLLSPNPASWTFTIARPRCSRSDELLRHKTDWRDQLDHLRLQAGTDELVFCNDEGEITEGSRSNIFVRRQGRLLTPRLDAGVLPGCLRAELLERGEAQEAILFPGDLDGETYFGNSLRGLIRAVRA